MFMRIADHQSYAGQSGHFFRSALRIASGNNDLSLRILSMDAAHRRARILIGGSGYGAGVEDNDSGCVRSRGPVKSQLTELTLYGGAVRLGGAAAEIFYVESGHEAILA
jgi:hypothetical protein